MAAGVVEEEIAMLRRALDGRVGSSEDAQSKFIQEFLELDNRRYACLHVAYQNLQQVCVTWSVS